MHNDRNELTPTAVGEGISTAIDEGERPESMTVRTQSDHRQIEVSTTLQSLEDLVSFSLFITLSKA